MTTANTEQNPTGALNIPSPEVGAPITGPIRAPQSGISDAEVAAALAGTPAAAPATSAPAPAQTSVPVIDVDGDADIPQDAELIRLSRHALKSRLERNTRSELKSRFGTDNVDEIKGKLERLSKFEAEQETQRVAQLSEIDRERELRTKAEGERDQYRKQVLEIKTGHSLRQEQTRVERIAGEHMNPLYMKYEIPEFARYLKNTFSREELKNLSDDKIAEYFSKLARERPETAKVAAAVVAPVPRVAPLTNGARTTGEAPPRGPEQPQSLSPSAPNALSSAAARAEARRQGYNY